jgi:hypothetical protein
VQKQADKPELAICQVNCRFQSLQALPVTQCEHDDGGRGVDGSIGKDSGKDGTHAFELQGNTTSVFLGGVTDYAEVWRANFEPGINLRTGDGDEAGE